MVELVKQFEVTKRNLEKAQATLTTTETELKEIKKVTNQYYHTAIAKITTTCHRVMIN